MAVGLTTLIALKLARLLFDVHLPWLYIVALVVFVAGTVVIVGRQRRRT
jgi:hypothetical protein